MPVPRYVPAVATAVIMTGAFALAGQSTSRTSPAAAGVPAPSATSTTEQESAPSPSSDGPQATATVTATATPVPADKPRALAPGETPPQFVVFSWDGGGNPLLQQRFRRIMQQYNGHMTVFLTGIYFLPRELRTEYKPPGRPAGASDISFARSEESARGIISSIFEAYHEGHEIGTHFNGHFCGKGGVSSWSPTMWGQEIDEALRLVTNYKDITGISDLPDVPFDYVKEMQGSRTPCLEGQKNLLIEADKRGWRYDSSGVGDIVWPQKFDNHDMWNIPMQQVPWKDGKTILSMDYNYMVAQTKGNPKGPVDQFPRFRQEVRDSLIAGIDQAYHGNRAPIIIGNHFNTWNGGVYMDAVDDVMNYAGSKEDVRLVSFEELVDWLEAQDPATLAKLQALGKNQAPQGGWAAYLGAPATTPGPQQP